MTSTEQCEGDDCPSVNQPLHYCLECDCSFCDLCWDRQPAHRPKKTGATRRQHERIDRTVVEKYQDILEPTSNRDEQAQLHDLDEDTTWFGVGRDEAGDPSLQDFPRYASLVAASMSEEHEIRYPQLVSFIGQTGLLSSSAGLLILTSF